jgi:hypothetical protein
MCFFLGGIVSEFVQSLLPVRRSPFPSLAFLTHTISAQYKTFQFGDIVVRFSFLATLRVVNSI